MHCEASAHLQALMSGCRNIWYCCSEGFRFRVSTYNILAETYATLERHPYVPCWALEFEYRRQRILTQLRQYESDIICLQVWHEVLLLFGLLFGLLLLLLLFGLFGLYFGSNNWLIRNAN
jgi:hypothetical protein